jgi:LPXTG-site transpeptidase (sortase) family protein
LEIPALDVEAPVEQGTGDAVLAVAVGHDPYSIWPGAVGTSVLLSHDVTYFTNIGHLNVGQVAMYSTPCEHLVYKVTSKRIVSAGSSIYNSKASTIALVTCYPSNALFYTNERQVVSLNLVKDTPSLGGVPLSLNSTALSGASARAPTVRVPKALASQGLTLASNYAPMGTLSIRGDPNPRFVQSPAPLLAEEAGLVAYFGALKSLAEEHTDWWSAIAPGVVPPSALIGHRVASYSSALDVTVQANRIVITGVAIDDTVIVNGVAHQMTVEMAISARHVLTITSWTM